MNVFPYLVCFFRSSSTYAKIQEWLGRIPPKIQKFAYFSLVSLSPRTRSRPGAERIWQGGGRLSRPPKTVIEFSSENRILRPRRKKSPDRIPKKKNDHIYIFIVLVRRFCGGRPSTMAYKDHGPNNKLVLNVMLNELASLASRRTDY